MELLDKLKNPSKRLINIKRKDNKCFLWCHIRHLNPSKIHPERITKADKKKRFMILIMKVLNFLFLKEIIVRLKRKIMFALMYLLMEII